MLNRLDLERVHQPSDAIGRRTKDLHQVVFKRDEEFARSRVALAARAPTQLIVDTPALMALGADDVQTADVGHPLTKDDVGAASGHVGRDRDRAGLTSLGDDAGLALV